MSEQPFTEKQRTAPVPAPILLVKNLTKSFTIHQFEKNITGCKDISFTLPKGKFIGITGRSGSGKSTILKLIYRTYLPQDGEIRYESEKFGNIDLTKTDERTIISIRRREIGYVSQFLRVIPRTTAREIVEEALLETGTDDETARKHTEETLSHFELDRKLWDSYPVTFSGGEKLRLNIAHAMVKRPRLLLLDEPTASLDTHSKMKVRQVIEQLKNAGTTMLGIFHDLEFMEGLCDTEFNMDRGILTRN